jgi:hypothetical protein
MLLAQQDIEREVAAVGQLPALLAKMDAHVADPTAGTGRP